MNPETTVTLKDWVVNEVKPMANKVFTTTESFPSFRKVVLDKNVHFIYCRWPIYSFIAKVLHVSIFTVFTHCFFLNHMSKCISICLYYVQKVGRIYWVTLFRRVFFLSFAGKFTKELTLNMNMHVPYCFCDSLLATNFQNFLILM